MKGSALAKTSSRTFHPYQNNFTQNRLNRFLRDRILTRLNKAKFNGATPIAGG
jgi:hypothetical protein